MGVRRRWRVAADCKSVSFGTSWFRESKRLQRELEELVTIRQNSRLKSAAQREKMIEELGAKI